MVWEGQMAPRQSTATAEERYLKGLMTPEEKFEYEKQRYAQSFAEQDAAQAQLDEQANAERAAAEQAARFQGEMALGPREVAYRAQYGGPSPEFLASLSPNWVEEEGFQIPMDPSVGAPMAPPTGAPVRPPTDTPPVEPEGRDYGADISEVRDRYMGAGGLLREAEGAYTTRRGEIAEQYRTGEEARVTQAQEELNKAKSVLGIATEKLSNWDINPQRAFPNAFSKIAAVISVAMGAYAQGLSGGKLPNTALGIINNAIKTDIDAQKMEYQQLKGLVDEKRNVYGMAMRLLGNAEQAEQVAYSAAYQTYQAEINKIGKEYGLEYGAIKLDSEIDARNRQLEVNAAKAASGGGKLSAEMKRSMTAYSSLGPKVRRLWDMSKNMNVARGYLDKFWPGETTSKEFERLAEQAAADMVYAISGVTARQEEYDRAKKWAPRATDFEGMRIAKMIGLMEYAVEKGVEHYHATPDHLKATLSPHLRAMYEMTEDQRRGAVLTMLEGKGHNVQDSGWEAEIGGVRSGIKKSTFGDLGGESVTGKK